MVKNDKLRYLFRGIIFMLFIWLILPILFGLWIVGKQSFVELLSDIINIIVFDKGDDVR